MNTTSTLQSPSLDHPGTSKLLFLAVLLSLLLLPMGPAAEAVVCGLDHPPGASLLLPYFEVDTLDPAGITTLMSIHNADVQHAAVLVTVWSDLGAQVLAFNAYLLPHDVLTINLRDMLNGTLPATRIPDGVSYPDCPTTLPVDDPDLPPIVPYLRDALTGQPTTLPGVEDDVAFGLDLGDFIARGFITVDVVNRCTTETSEDPSFWIDGGAGVGSNRNILWGDYFYVDTSNDFAQGMNLVHLEADDAFGPADYTFYRRSSGGADNREPLASVHGVRFAEGGAFDGGTTLFYWRDAKRSVPPFEPGTIPEPFPLQEAQIVVYDEQDNFTIVTPTDLDPFAAVAGRVEVGGPTLPVPYEFGWIYIDINTDVDASQVPFGPLTQSYFAYEMSALGRFSVGLESTALAGVCESLP